MATRRVALLDAGVVVLAGAALGRTVGLAPLLAGLVAVALLRLVAGRARPRRAGRSGAREALPTDTDAGGLVLVHDASGPDEERGLAVTDALTGLPNRRSLERALVEHCRSAAIHGTALGVLVLGLRDADTVRRVYGPQAARDVLRQTGERLRQSLDASAVVGRWAGEHFVAVVPGVRTQDLPALAERLRALLEADPFRLSSGRRVAVAIAGGWAATPGDGISGAFLVSSAQARASAAQAPGGALAR